MEVAATTTRESPLDFCSATSRSPQAQGDLPGRPYFSFDVRQQLPSRSRRLHHPEPYLRHRDHRPDLERQAGDWLTRTPGLDWRGTGKDAFVSGMFANLVGREAIVQITVVNRRLHQLQPAETPSSLPRVVSVIAIFRQLRVTGVTDRLPDHVGARPHGYTQNPAEGQ